MNINEQFEAQQKEIAELKAKVLALNKNISTLKRSNRYIKKQSERVREELNELERAGGINAIKADAIEILGDIMGREFGEQTGKFVEYYVDKLRTGKS